MIRLTAILADAAGGSRFADLVVPTDSVRLFDAMPPFRLAAFTGTGPVRFFAVPAELDEADFHNTPRRQLSVALNGWVEYETTDGERRRFPAGEPVLVADLTGRGHITRFAPGEQRFLHIPVPADWLAAGATDRDRVA